MLHKPTENEKDWVRQSFRPLMAAWFITSSILAVLLQIGFVNFPANSRDLTEVKNVVVENKTEIKTLNRSFSSMQTGLAVEKTNLGNLDRRLSRMENNQTKILQLLGGSSN